MGDRKKNIRESLKDLLLPKETLDRENATITVRESIAETQEYHAEQLRNLRKENNLLTKTVGDPSSCSTRLQSTGTIKFSSAAFERLNVLPSL